MAQEKKNVFEQLQEALSLIAEELHNANDALYVVATETMDLNGKLDTLSSKIDAIISTATKITPVTTEKPAVKKTEPVKFSFEKLRKEMK